MNPIKRAFVSYAAAALLVSATLGASASFAQSKPAKPAKGKPTTSVQTARITVEDTGFKPSSLSLKAGVPARVTFTRTGKATCATSVVMPAYNVRKELPLGKPVTVTFTPKKTGTFGFACGMNMVKGSVIVR